jgi:putative flippase GtrA
VSVVESVLRIPKLYQGVAVRHLEFLKFGSVGAFTFVLDTGIFYALKLTVLSAKPVTAKVVAVFLATVVSYVLNRGWSFRTRAGRHRRVEMTLYFMLTGLSMALYVAPLWIARYVLHLEVPYVSRLAQEISDFVFGQIVGVLAGMMFRWWAFRKWVFPHRDR